MFLSGSSPSHQFMGSDLQIYTLNNGTYPEVIEMSKEGLSNYILKYYPMNTPKDLTFNGIPIKVNTNDTTSSDGDTNRISETL